MIRLDNVTKIYTTGGTETAALRGISLEIEDGDYLAIMGTSGSGKSTLLHIIGCMDTLTGGAYRFDETEIHKLNMKQLHRFRKEHISFVFQNFALLNQYSVYENVELPLIAKGVSAGKRREIVSEVLEKVGIAELKNKRPIHISGGQQQRCAIARALASGNQVILADEPTGALDQKTSQDVMNLFEQIHQEGRTVIIVTHDPGVAERCGRVVRMEDGVLL